jgi:carboxypeptidase Q
MKQLVSLAFGVALVTSAAEAQRPGGGAPPGQPQGTPITAPYVRTTPPEDRVIAAMWAEGNERSQAAALAQVLTDSIGPRLTGSPGMMAASDWVLSMYKQWGVPARREQYGTWNAWKRGVTHLDMTAPRTRSLEAVMLSWSPGTKGRAVEGEVVTLPDVSTPEAFTAWLPQAKGKFVLASAPQLSCRSALQWMEFGTTESRENYRAAQQAVSTGWPARALAAGGANNMQDRLLAAGAAGVLTSNWSQYPGVNKIFGTTRQKLPTLDVSCEDYGALFRMAEKGQKPRVRLVAESESLGERPVFNTIAEIRGSEKPNEYVVLSAHFDSWEGASGATDNATGTITMMEALRILKATYPNPKRTIIVGHWSGEEQGLNGSRAFTEDHPEVVTGLQALFNQDNGTGRVVNMGPGALPGAGPVLERYLGQLPSSITQYIRLSGPSGPATGGSDNASFACHGAPAFGLGALGWDYSNTTWHTNRDTFDKIVIDDLKSNAMLTAMLTYLASEDPQPMPRDRLNPLPAGRDGQPGSWPACGKAMRSSAEYRR